MKRKVFADSLFVTGANFIIKLKGIIFIPIVIKFIGLEYYGVYTQIIANVSTITPFCQFALGQGFYRYTSKFDDKEISEISRDYWTVMSATILLSFIGAAAVYMCSPIISEKILDGLSLNSIRLSSLLIFTAVISSVNNKFIQCRKKFKFYSVFQVIYALIPYLALITGVVMHRSLFIALILYLAAEIILNMIMFFFIFSQVRLCYPSINRAVYFFKFSSPLTVSSISGGLLSKMDRYFIGYFCGPQAIGVYSIIYSICSFVHQLSVPFSKYFLVYLPKVWDDSQQDNVKKQLRNGMKFYFIISSCCAVLLSFTTKPLVLYLLDKDLSYISNFETLFLLLGYGIILLGISQFFYHITVYQEKTINQTLYQIFGVFVNAILNYFLIKKFGITGAALATLLSYLSIVLLCLITLKIGLNTKFGLKFLFILFASASMVLLFSVNNSEDFIVIMMNSFLSLSIYFTLLFFFRVVSIQEIKGVFFNF